MRSRLQTLILLFFSLSASANLCVAQQSYFNVPSSDCTQKGTFFFQEQLNHDHNEFTSNTTLDWGIAKNFEAGINVVQVNYNIGEGFRTSQNSTISNGQIFPMVTLNSQYFIPLNEHHQISAAAMIGFGLQNQKSTTKYGFINYQFKNEKIKLTTGIYSGNKPFVGFGENISNNIKSPIGVHIGTEINLWEEHLSLISDYISGTNALGMKTFGFAYKVPRHWIISLGGFWANKNSNNPNGVVMEFTRVIE